MLSNDNTYLNTKQFINTELQKRSTDKYIIYNNYTHLKNMLI